VLGRAAGGRQLPLAAWSAGTWPSATSQTEPRPCAPARPCEVRGGHFRGEDALRTQRLTAWAGSLFASRGAGGARAPACLSVDELVTFSPNGDQQIDPTPGRVREETERKKRGAGVVFSLSLQTWLAVYLLRASLCSESGKACTGSESGAVLIPLLDVHIEGSDSNSP
jgi:hypothetical protein